MTNQEIFETALEQSAADLHCTPDDFLRGENVVVLSRASDKARKYLSLPFDCNLVSYGNNIVASVREDLADVCAPISTAIPSNTVLKPRICTF